MTEKKAAEQHDAAAEAKEAAKEVAAEAKAEAREQQKAEAAAQGVSARDLARGYEEVQWSGRTLYHPLGAPSDRTFDYERDAQDWVAKHGVYMGNVGGVAP
jgi:hypothetical protein